jgi:S-adenosylmethionine/arginine decarboxylase-like enzyme
MDNLGNVFSQKATLKAENLDLMRLDILKEMSLGTVKYYGFCFRRFSVERYPGHCYAHTLVSFIDESHLVLTTYPEISILEVELSSCKIPAPGKDFRKYIASCSGFTLLESSLMVKNLVGKWCLECS